MNALRDPGQLLAGRGGLYFLWCPATSPARGLLGNEVFSKSLPPGWIQALRLGRFEAFGMTRT